jgi:hypothetical protein
MAMAEMTFDPDEQTGTGAPRSAPSPGDESPDGAEDTLRAPEPAETREQVNRSGSGGTGEPSEGSEPPAEPDARRRLSG